MSIYDLACTDLRGNSLPMNNFRGHPLLIVNTASLCGFSGQLRQLETVWESNKTKGLVVIGVPSDDFGNQEPGSDIAVASVCSVKFGVTFPLLGKTHVRGNAAHPLFQWLAKEGGFWARPRWNFYKYLVGADGRLQNWFSSLTSPATPRFLRAVGALTSST